ncbi:iron-sulfur cluster carrier protein ApbC [Acinetobacter soli]|jgi:ATP-binding protein involved in chromosome partitioning|uniref:Iron-sulfur cluster carrier protein n=1 Tax=Acinetobacter soli TaxID=487316 RepID=A0A1P8EJ82_9GAMM|nr:MULTISPECIES: iron-sulfur cluster carrier protein ApbC [Acinetobacter]APV36276.1 ATP-binding protein [Acinetobacter soli]MBO3671991.1 iron-sulfur cluster carrier protein ApbC [Acinetobacter soli]MBV6552057.1 iron-sulfur cluster carrier protein ApbC [Acinetobacter soli]RSB53483.1 iron-sulfur cluster carrier protein ApbC [Acinetobacter soli]WON79263.1 iron-sulfur cluster carrier protein ApbC [Acinetobacter sp. UGAL515B_02]
MSWLSSLKSVFSPAQEVKEEDIQAILQAYRLTGHSFELKDRITQVNVQGRVLQLTIKTYPEEADHLQQIHDELAGALQGAGIEELNLHVIQQKTAPRTQEVAATLPPVVDASASPTPDPNNPPIQKKAPLQSEVAAHPRIQHVILVSSGKGGVGKSTTTVNLALALHKQGLKVGVLDADIYGPSIPTMLGNAGQTPMIENESFVPLEAHGLAVLSIGHLTGDHNTPVAWRGPKATGALMQLFNQTLWPDLDVLVIDMPPGTGDIQLTLAQRIPVSGAVIVTTPQNVALLDATKGIELFNRVGIPVLGVIENMSTHICSNCGFEEQIFGTGGGDQLSEQYQIPLLGRLPLNGQIRENADKGQPSVVAQDAAAESYELIAQALWSRVADLPQRARDDKRIF